MNSYHQFVSDAAALVQRARDIPLASARPPEPPRLSETAPKALIFSPHPDDEVIVGGLPLRLLRESGMRVLNVAVTQGSNKARQPERWAELSACCRYIGFGLLQTQANGLEGISLKGREQNPGQWAAAVRLIAEIINVEKPKVVFFPHARDWNGTHIGTHQLVVEALQRLAEFACYTVENEFWGAMDDPNLMVELTVQDVADLITALSFHVGEVSRNPYHLRLSAWLMDNVRRGGELVGGQGGAAPDFTFGTLYRLRRWEAGQFKSVLARGRFLSAQEDPGTLFP